MGKIQGTESTGVRSSYEEDILNNNHIAVWGSWWSEGLWGYKCCHGRIKNSYCTGEAGKTVKDSTLTLPPPAIEKEEKSLVELKKEKAKKKKKKSKKKKKKKKSQSSSSSSSSSSSDSDSDSDTEKEKAEKLKLALSKLEAQNKAADRYLSMDERK